MRINIGRTHPIVVSGFPGIGKSHFKANSELTVSDSDSSKFDKTEFPQNYLQHIQDLYVKGDTDIILVSSHDPVRQGLIELGITFILVYPNIECKEEYLERYKQRGSPAAFIDMMDKNWESFIKGCENQGACFKIELEAGEYLSDADLTSRRC